MVTAEGWRPFPKCSLSKPSQLVISLQPLAVPLSLIHMEMVTGVASKSKALLFLVAPGTGLQCEICVVV